MHLFPRICRKNSWLYWINCRLLQCVTRCHFQPEWISPLLGPQKYSRLIPFIKKKISARVSHAVVSAAPVLFRFRTHPQIIYVARYYTQKLCSRRAYERTIYFAQSRATRKNNASLARAYNIGTDAAWEDKSAVQSHATAAVWLNYITCLKDKGRGTLSDLLIENASFERPLKSGPSSTERAGPGASFGFLIYSKFA